MSGDQARGPGGLVLYEAGLDPSRLDLSGGPGEWKRLPAMGLRDFVDEYLRGEDAARVCLFLDAPRRTATRVAAALACARSLLTMDRSVIVVDGDDQRPDLSAWAGRTETEGWVDVVRYGVSPEAAGEPLPWGPQAGRVMGVGSYHPVRAESAEAAALVKRLLDDYDTVIICASTGDRGAFWAGLDALRVLCWDRAAASPDETAALVRDAATLGADIDTTIAFGVAGASSDGPRLESPGPDAVTPRRSSPIFRRLAISMTVLVVVLGSWFLGQLARRDSDSVSAPEQTVAEPVVAVMDTTGTDSTPIAMTDSDRDTTGAPVEEGESIETVTDSAPTVPASTVPVLTDLDRIDPEQAAAEEGIDWSARVESGAYCLHVYSMADSAMARDQLQWMRRRGVDGLVRRWTDADGKTWYRIYAGSFATMGGARSAMPELYERLDTDWALPKRTERIR